MKGSKNIEYTIGNIADIVDTMLDQASVEEILKILVDKIPALFSEDNVSASVQWKDNSCGVSSCSDPDMTIASDIVVNGKKEGSIKIILKNKDITIKENEDLIRDYQKLLHLISRMVSVFFEKRVQITELKDIGKRAKNYCDKLEDYIFVVNNKGNIIDFNVNFVNCTGYTPEELMKMHINELMSQCSTEISESPLIKEAIKNGSSTHEFERVCKTGEKIPMSVVCKPLDDIEEEAFICVAKDVSKTKMMESELHESEKKYSTIVEKGNDAILILQNGLVKFANTRIFDITGLKKENIINKSYLNLIPEIEHENCFEWFSDHENNVNEKNIFTVEMLTKEDRTIPVEINCSVIDYQGEKAELLIIRDISERMRSEELLKKERDRLENYLDVVGSIIGIVNSDSEIIFVNQVGAETLGYPKEEIIGRNWFDDFLPESVRELTRESFFKVMADELTPPQYFENLILTKDGEERLIFWHDVPLEDENGKRIGMISSGEDITENRKIKKLLVESEKNLKTLFDHIDDQIFIYRPYGKFMAVSRAVIESTGYTHDELLDMSPPDLVKTEMQPLMEGYTDRIMSRKNVIFEISHIHKDGSQIPLEVNAKLADYKGEQAIISVARDITERKKAEERLKRYAGELKHSNELKDLFTDIIRHDLLTPASVIKGYTEELLLAIKDENARKLATKVKENNERLIELLETATKLAKLQKEEDITFDTMDIVGIFKMVVDGFKPQLDDKEQTIVITGNKSCSALVNPVIEEVFVNLLSNAIKYSPEKGNIEVNFTDEGRMCKMSITDQGAGIPDDEKPLLFNRFHRADKKGIKGTGLGLAIVKRAIELHGGEYGVNDSEIGTGSTFWIKLRKSH